MGSFLKKNWKFSQIFSLEKSPKCPKFFWSKKPHNLSQKKIIASHVLEKGIRGYKELHHPWFSKQRAECGTNFRPSICTLCGATTLNPFRGGGEWITANYVYPLEVLTQQTKIIQIGWMWFIWMVFTQG